MMTFARSQWLDLVRFALIVCAIVLLAYGARLHYPPLGYVTAGGALLIVMLVGLWRAR